MFWLIIIGLWVSHTVWHRPLPEEMLLGGALFCAYLATEIAKARVAVLEQIEELSGKLDALDLRIDELENTLSSEIDGISRPTSY